MAALVTRPSVAWACVALCGVDARGRRSMVSHPSQSALQHLRWFFIVFASGGVLALPGSMPRMPQQDIMRE